MGVDITWSLLNSGKSALDYFNQGRSLVQDVQHAQEERAVKSALATYAQNPDDPEALKALAQHRPEIAIKIGEDRRAKAARAQEQRRADIPLLTKLVEGSVDEATFQQNRATAQQYGIDTSNLPAQFDPAWREQTLKTLQVFQDPKKMEAVSTAGKQAVDMGFKPGTPEFNAKVTEIWTTETEKTIPYTQGGGVAGYNPATGQTRTIIAPNPGGFAPGAPVSGGAAPPRVRSIEEAKRLPPGTRFVDPNGVERIVPGGPTPQASGTFRPSVSGSAPVSNGAAVVSQLFPNARITQNRRDPNSALGRANPTSWHNRSGGAVDVAPIKGMTFEQYVSRVKAAGYDVIEARDEVKNPSKHATGPHWHIVIGEG